MTRVWWRRLSLTATRASSWRWRPLVVTPGTRGSAPYPTITIAAGSSSTVSLETPSTGAVVLAELRPARTASVKSTKPPDTFSLFLFLHLIYFTGRAIWTLVWRPLTFPDASCLKASDFSWCLLPVDKDLSFCCHGCRTYKGVAPHFGALQGRNPPFFDKKVKKRKEKRQRRDKKPQKHAHMPCVYLYF